MTYHAAHYCTISSFWMFLWACRSHTILAYSKRGLNRVKYACCLLAIGPILLLLKVSSQEDEGSVGFGTCVIDVGVSF